MGDERSANAVDKKLGDRVRARRLEIGMSQEQLAERLGVTFQQVQKYEKGVNRIAASRLYDIADALNVPVTYFFEGLKQKAGKRASDGDVSEALSVLGAHELVRSYAGVKDQRLRRRLLDLVIDMSETSD